MSRFVQAQVSMVAARRTVRVQAVDPSRSAAPAIVGAALTIAAVVASVLVFATI